MEAAAAGIDIVAVACGGDRLTLPGLNLERRACRSSDWCSCMKVHSCRMAPAAPPAICLCYRSSAGLAQPSPPYCTSLFACAHAPIKSLQASLQAWEGSVHPPCPTAAAGQCRRPKRHKAFCLSYSLQRCTWPSRHKAPGCTDTDTIMFEALLHLRWQQERMRKGKTRHHQMIGRLVPGQPARPCSLAARRIACPSAR